MGGKVLKTKKIYMVTIVTLILLGFNFSNQKDVLAEESLDEVREKITGLEKQQNNAKSRSDDVDQKQNETQSKINSNITQQNSINEQIKVLDGQVADTQAKLREKEEEIKSTEKEIDEKMIQIAEMQERIEERDKLLKERFRTIQRNGGDVSYLEVIMGAQSFGDFLNRATAVNKIMGQDKDILDKHNEEKAQLEKVKEELENQKMQLVKKKQELDGIKKELEQQVEEKERLMKKLKQEEKELRSYKLELQEEEEILRKQQATIKKMIEEAKREAKRLEQLSHSGNKGFARPTNVGRVTSHFGPRWGDEHNGIDIGKDYYGQQVPILASAEGVVNRSYYSYSYGNVVFITHYIEGQVYTTVYAHMQNREVYEGQRVHQGQRLGYMGTTGNSTGPHLHFEFHKGPWLPGQPNSVNPTKYINFNY